MESLRPGASLPSDFFRTQRVSVIIFCGDCELLIPPGVAIVSQATPSAFFFRAKGVACETRPAAATHEYRYFESKFDCSITLRLYEFFCWLHFSSYTTIRTCRKILLWMPFWRQLHGGCSRYIPIGVAG